MRSKLIPPPSSNDKLLNMLAAEAYKHGDFTLASGRKSHHYVNCKPVTLSGEGLLLLSSALLEKIDPASKAVAGLTLGADPLVSGVALLAAQKGLSLNALIVRKEPKGHGTSAWLEGPLLSSRALVTVLEDVVTTGGSSLKAVKQLRNAGYVVNSVVSIVDRQEGADHLMDLAEVELSSIFRLNDVAARAKELSL